MSATARDVIRVLIADKVNLMCGTISWEDGRTTGREVSDAILSALAAAGYAVVPKEPTEAMKIAAVSAVAKHREPEIERLRSVGSSNWLLLVCNNSRETDVAYKAMLEASTEETK